MSTITKERLEPVIERLEHYATNVKWTNVQAAQDMLIAVDAMRRLLASLEAEAVGEVVLGEYDDCGCHPDAKVVCIAADGQADWGNFKDGTPLYTAPPAPVSVPDESAVELLATELMKRIDKITGERHSLATLSSLRVSIVEACRAAMLQGADGNSPVIPDSWVACSERLPENKPGSYEYLVFEGLNNRVQHDYWNVPDAGDDCQFTPFWNHYGRYVTHWMPLPAAPQQEVTK
ncbi:TPA: DUF551 domain-containing protein [Enterobacter cloacae]|nr:DUF551 domain-containing protein [Enterobacter cloacae]